MIYKYLSLSLSYHIFKTPTRPTPFPLHPHWASRANSFRPCSYAPVVWAMAGYGYWRVLVVFYMTITALPTLESWCKTWNLESYWSALVSNSSKFGAWPLRLSSHLVWASQEPGKLCCRNGDPPDTFTRGPSKMKSIVQQRGWHDYHDTDKNDYVASDDIPKD